MYDFRVILTLVCILALLLTSYVTLMKSSYLSEPPVPLLAKTKMVLEYQWWI